MRPCDRPSGRAHPFDFLVEHLPAPLLEALLEILLQDRIRHLYPFRVGGFWVKQSGRVDVQDVDHVQFRVSTLAQVHRRAGGKFGLAGPICSQQYLRRKNAHDLLLGFPYGWTIWLLLPLQGSLGYTARGRRALLNPPRSPPAPRDPGPRLAPPFHLQNTALLEVPYGTVNRLPGSTDHRPQIQPSEAQPHPRASVWVTFAEPTEQDRHQRGQPCLGLARQEAS